MLTIYRSEGSASLRRVPVWLVGSDGTSPATGEAGGQPQICFHARGTGVENTSGTLSLVSANAGLYHVELNASQVSALGVFSINYRSANAIAQTVFGKVVNYDSGDSTRLGLFALPNAAADASGGLPLKGTTHSNFTVRIEGVSYSGATVGAGNIAPGTYSAVSVSLRDGGIGTATYQAGTYSNLTVAGLNNYANISNVPLHAGTHSNVTIQGVTRVNSAVTPADALYSAVTVRIEGVSYSGATIDGVRMIATAGERSIASSWMSTNLGQNRYAQEALFVLRNRVPISGSTMTV